MVNIHTLKQKFIIDSQKTFSYDNDEIVKNFEILVTLVKLPTGSIETIINNTNIESKVEYIMKAYDHEFKLIANPNVEIVAYTIY